MNLSLIANDDSKPEAQMPHPQDNADLIIEYLKTLEVDYVFGVPGGAIEPLYNALARSQAAGGPRAIIARHEAGAAFMAEGYARETGKLGVCCATTGPGATNLLTGTASAFADNVPMLVITAQTPLPKFGKNALQESSCTAIDTVGIFRHCTRYNTLVSHTEQLNNKVISAIMSANRVPSGPSHISIPSDILRQKPSENVKIKAERLKQEFTLTDNAAVEQLTDMLSSAWRVALFLGKGCGSSIDEIMEFAELTRAPIMTGPAGKRWINGFHPLYRGVYGFAGHQSAEETMKDDTIDLVLAVGTQITELGTGGWQSSLLSDRLVHIDSTVEHFSRSPMAQLHVCGDLKSIFQQLNENVRLGIKWGRTWDAVDPVKQNYLDHHIPSTNHGYQIRQNEPDKCFSNDIPLKPQRIATEFSRRIPSTFRIHLDAGNVWSWFTHYFHRASAKGHYHIAMGLGSMGWAIGASVGNALGSNEPSVCITGDGSYLMSGQEITTALQQKLPVIYVVFNDSALGMVMHGQRLGGAEQIGFQLPPINFAKMAEAMGIEGIRVETPEDLVNIDWKRLGEKQGPTMIDLLVDGEEIPPMGQRVKGLANESATPGG
ncbi:thiamine pyrophosphate-binding protein [Aliikangiella coralliicola]|uniref:Thiamine pyrophosphate-binding protein n=1 Tax=Aliikangiella coralliicola TaxID=2592383 RepID=A0A545U512_9GAMM|nr:thiamine pyrophosphate-binding protein [Aliikangiella coralliicola]TQV84561.1 thiamine pyrophosphate-binding protein [Aliikangiella coralliicola]